MVGGPSLDGSLIKFAFLNHPGLSTSLMKNHPGLSTSLMKNSLLIYIGGFHSLNFLREMCLFKVDGESCYCEFLLRTKIIWIVSLLLLVYGPAFSFMSWWTWQLRFFLELRLRGIPWFEETLHLISNWIINFLKLLLFFQNKEGIADSL